MPKRRRPHPGNTTDETPLKPPDKSRAEKVFVTPQMAKRWLECNTNNRPCARIDIFRLLGAIERGEWWLNGETIKFDTEMVLRDGQTRLAAIIEADTGVWSWVIFDLDDRDNAVFNSTDEGRKRTLGHLLSVAGWKNYNCLAAAIRTVYDLDVDVPFDSAGFSASIGRGILADHPNINASLVYVLGHDIRSTYNVGTAAGMHYVMSKQDPDAADHFWESFATGVFTSAKSPVKQVRDIVIANKNAKADHRLTPTTIQALIIKAWNLLREGHTRKSLRWNSEKENFPMIG